MRHRLRERGLLRPAAAAANPAATRLVPHLPHQGGVPPRSVPVDRWGLRPAAAAVRHDQGRRRLHPATVLLAQRHPVVLAPPAAAGPAVHRPELHVQRPWEAGHCHAPCEHANFSGLPYCNRSLDLDARVADAVARLTLGEKISNTMASVSGL